MILLAWVLQALNPNFEAWWCKFSCKMHCGTSNLTQHLQEVVGNIWSTINSKKTTKFARKTPSKTRKTPSKTRKLPQIQKSRRLRSLEFLQMWCFLGLIQSIWHLLATKAEKICIERVDAFKQHGSDALNVQIQPCVFVDPVSGAHLWRWMAYRLS